jgi:undecaprenyl pyrophosphate phosphatase UppP
MSGAGGGPGLADFQPGDPRLDPGSRASKILGSRRAEGSRGVAIATISTLVVVSLIVFFILHAPNWPAFKQAFFDGKYFREFMPGIARAFLVNVKIFLTAEVFILVFALLLEWADRAMSARETEDFQTRDAVVMGVAQALALAPGVSRSGVTISAGRWLRFDRPAATRVSFLMSIPIIGGATLYKGAQLARDGIPSGFGSAFVWGVVASAVSGFLAIAFLLRYVRTHSFRPFVIYRIVVGIAIIVVFATGIR